MKNCDIIEGIINLNKPAGMTSHDCIGAIRRLTGVKRIGHTGTLDPNATGVLPICIGSSARINEYLDMDFKKYRCSLQLGITTETQDVWGEVITDIRKMLKETKGSQLESQFCNTISEQRIKAAFKGFNGHIEQYPPKYSAIRVNGKRLYEYARKGLEVEIKPRKVYIKSLQIEKIDLDDFEIIFTVECSKGTYIRSICQEIGEILGCGAAMSGLQRLASGAFLIEDAVTLEELKSLKVGSDEIDEQTGKIKKFARADFDKLEKYIMPTDFPLGKFGKAVIKEKERAKWFVNGGHIAMSEVNIQREPYYKTNECHLEIRPEFQHAYNMYGALDGKVVFLGVAFYDLTYGKLVADKVFQRNNI